MKVLKRSISILILGFTVITNSIMVSAAEEIQLTDYHYANAQRGLYGYNFFNGHFANININKTGKSSIALNEKSIILKPDGTELFQAGKFDVRIDYIEFPESISPYYEGFNRNAYLQFSFPQHGNDFILFENGINKVCMLNGDGEITNSWDVLPFFDSVCFVNEDTAFISMALFTADVTDKFPINVGDVFSAAFINVNNGTIAAPWDYDDYIKELYTTAKQIYPYNTCNVYADSEQKYFYIYENKVSFYFDALGNRIEKPEGVEFYPIELPMDYYGLKWGEGITTDKIDTSYIFKEKEIGGKTYYALFKELKDGETAEDYLPKEQPSVWAVDSISKATEAGLLYNNANCRYKDNISRQDFCILAVEAFCKSQGMEVDEYINANNITLDFEKFKDTSNAYVLLANELGIVSGTSETEFSPDRGITRQEAAVMLNNIAKLSNLTPNSEKVDYVDSDKFAAWAKEAIESITSIKNNEGITVMNSTMTNEERFSPWNLYSREQAYVTIYRLFEMCEH